MVFHLTLLLFFLIRKSCIKSVLGVLCFPFGFFFVGLFVFSGGDFVSSFVCLYTVFIAAVWANSSLDLLLGWLVYPLSTNNAAGFLWHTELITTYSGMSSSTGHSWN